MEQFLRKVVADFEAASGLKVDHLVDFHTPFPDEGDLMLEVAVDGSDLSAFIRFTEDGELLDWGTITPSSPQQ